MQIIYKYIVCILLFTCLGFTQDTLITKQGKQYIGKVIDSDSTRKNLSILEKSFIDEKAVYNAKLVPMKKWYYYSPAIGTLFIGSHILDMVFYGIGIYNKQTYPLSISSGLYISHNIYKNFYLDNKNEIKYPESILTKSEKILYKHSYNKALKKRKIKNTLIGASPFIIAVGAFSVYLVNDFFPSSGPDLPDF
jgi:hypothetical protein